MASLGQAESTSEPMSDSYGKPLPTGMYERNEERLVWQAGKHVPTEERAVWHAAYD
jgi:hypothetical protein